MHTSKTKFSYMQWSRYFLAIVFLSMANHVYGNDLFAEESLRVGFHGPSFQEYSRADLEVSVKVLTEEMAGTLSIPTTVAIYDDIKGMRRAFEQGKINMIFASPFLMVTEFDNSLLADGFKLVHFGGSVDHLVVLTRKNAGTDTFQALRGKKLSLVDNDPSTDLYLNFLSQLHFKKDYSRVFKVMPREKKSHQIILKLFFDQVDAVCVYENFYRITGELNPQIFTKLQITEHIVGVLQNAGFFHKNVPQTFRDKVIAEATKLNTYERGRQFLEVFKTEQALRVSPTELDVTRQLYLNYQHRKKL